MHFPKQSNKANCNETDVLPNNNVDDQYLLATAHGTMKHQLQQICSKQNSETAAAANLHWNIQTKAVVIYKISSS